MSIVILVLIGVAAGIGSGIFGIGGGVVIVPALVLCAGFSHHRATGTSLAVLLPPIGLAAAREYYRHGHVDIRAALVVAASMFVGGWLGALFANWLNAHQLRLLFGIFLTLLGAYLTINSALAMEWRQG